MNALIILVFLINVNAEIMNENHKLSSRIATEFQNAQNEETIVKSIRQKYLAINGQLKSFRKVIKDVPDESAEGGELIAYYSGKSLKKITVMYFGETGKLENQYYFDLGQLIFKFSRKTLYDHPIGKEDVKIESISENQYYFEKGELMRWISPEKKYINIKSAAFKKAQQDLVEELTEVKRKLK